jgi:cation:H+ antiporter
MLASSIPLSLLVLAIGLVVLIVGADQLVEGSARLSRGLGLSPVVVGVVIIGFGTSTPELLVTLLAAVEGVFDLGVGNIVGSNIANVLLVVGAGAVVGPVVIGRTTLRREVPLSLLSVAAFAWAIQGPLRRLDALLLLVLLVVVVGLILSLARRDLRTGAPSAAVAGVAELDDGPVGTGSAAIRALLGLTATLAGAQAVVLSGGAIAEGAGLSEGLIGLTLVAVGTSLPELAAAVQAVRRQETDLLVGNVLGSNLFNALAVGPVVVWTGANVGRRVDPALAGTATWLMLAAVVAVSLLLLRRRIGRVGGIALLLAYAAAVAVMAR